MRREKEAVASYRARIGTLSAQQTNNKTCSKFTLARRPCAIFAPLSPGSGKCSSVVEYHWSLSGGRGFICAVDRRRSIVVLALATTKSETALSADLPSFASHMLLLGLLTLAALAAAQTTPTDTSIEAVDNVLYINSVAGIQIAATGRQKHSFSSSSTPLGQISLIPFDRERHVCWNRRLLP